MDFFSAVLIIMLCEELSLRAFYLVKNRKRRRGKAEGINDDQEKEKPFRIECI